MMGSPPWTPMFLPSESADLHKDGEFNVIYQYIALKIVAQQSQLSSN